LAFRGLALRRQARPDGVFSQLTLDLHSRSCQRPWEARDGSAVKGTVVERIERPGTIPELTLSAEQIGADHGLLAGVDIICRINTTGGLPPAGPCMVGAVQEVPYTATYVFSGPKPGDAAGE
jgi:hypothetical protein